ncbi:hypothetical protein TNCV_2069711 [Trichonephila clavipes]|uniref:Uncharacterized protein n=1 Tax=Trichonephila clavipes TaxID=2585209 RepID=A0A8X6W3T7_TRICX|nr:hypothetical protein TNCV_2069711 [Trichonephila clavipes]
MHVAIDQYTSKANPCISREYKFSLAENSLNEFINISEEERAKRLIIFSDCKAALQVIHECYLWLITNIHIIHFIVFLICKKQCIMQWIPVSVSIDENEVADTLVKKARQLTGNAKIAP